MFIKMFAAFRHAQRVGGWPRDFLPAAAAAAAAASPWGCITACMP